MKKKNLLSLSLAGMFLLITFLSPAQISEPKVKQSVFFGKSKPVKEMTIVLPGEHTEKQHIVINQMPYWPDIEYLKTTPDLKPKMQKKLGPLKCKGPLLNFDGVGNVNFGSPADPNGDVSPDYYLQSVNTSFAVWDKEGNLIYGPVDYKSLWDGFPGPWTYLLWSDPIFKYDRLADRWLISTVSCNLNQYIFYTMVAVSETSDPLGSYYCYGYEFEDFNDYPKLSVWPNGYYITYNMYEYTDTWYFLHSLVTVIERDAMLAGEPEATMIGFEISEPDSTRFFPLPADYYDTGIPADLPCYIASVDNHDPGNPWNLALDIYAFDPDWNTPANSTFEQISQLEIGEVEPVINFGYGAPQPNNDKTVATLPLYLMYPLSYRVFDNHETMVCCHTIWDGDIHYIKWYELRREDTDWYIYQSGNYAPDNIHRYQPSINVNSKGDIAMGYTVSDEFTFPSVRMTGRRAGDSLGEMTFQEIELFTGLNYINTYQSDFDQNRWGDYASMMIDPVDDSTFWFTNMYPLAETNSGNWGTRIFKINLIEEFETVTAYAGTDTVICEDDYIFVTQGEALNYNSILWTSNGDGLFLTNNSLDSKYIRGNGDIENGEVMLTIQAGGYEPGSAAVDSMMLYINKNPEAYAGLNDTIFSNESYTLQGEVEFSSEHEWTTSGDGMFNDPFLLDAIYTPGSNDILSGEVELILTAYPMQACQDIDDDDMTLTIELYSGLEFVESDDLLLKVSPN
ncbi:MAG: hypothetical protein K8R74_17205, partial [Bacteroidales bacterium]|nr:hypothetical protein [Bacteroidales bacterium]